MLELIIILKQELFQYFIKIAEIVENKKRFKVIKLRVTEMITIWDGGQGICDGCNQICTTDNGMEGYYIAVLNRVYCQEDYDKWMEHATRYEEDKTYEEMQFNQTKNLLGL